MHSVTLLLLLQTLRDLRLTHTLRIRNMLIRRRLVRYNVNAYGNARDSLLVCYVVCLCPILMETETTRHFLTMSTIINSRGILLVMPNCWLEVSIRKVLRPATSTQVSLGFPVSISKCWDGSQDSKLPLHASYLAPRLKSKFIINQLHIQFTCEITTATGRQPNCS